MRRVLLTLLLAVLCLAGLGSPDSGTHPDEATYLSIVAEMAQRGEWLTAYLEGEVNFYKPPLLYWAQRLSFVLLGQSLFAARLPSALAALALCLLTGALARKMAGSPEGSAADSAEVLAALLCAGSVGLLRFGRLAMMDAPFALALTLAGYGLWRGIHERSPLSLLWCALGAAASVMLKGPVGAVLVGLLCLSFAALRAPRLLVSPASVGAAALAALLALPWYAVSWSIHGRRYFDSFFLTENLSKFSGAWTLSGEAGLLGAVLLLLLPWTLLLTGAGPVRRFGEPRVLMPLLWMGVVLLVYSLPSVKFPHYVLPLVPPAVLLMVRSTPPRWALRGTGGLLALLALAALLLLRWPMDTAGLASVAGLGLTLAAASVLVFRARLIPAALAVVVAGTLAMAVVIPALVPPLLPPAALQAAQGHSLYFFGGNAGLHRFAAGRPVLRAWNEEHLSGLLGEGARIILSEAQLKALPDPLRGQTAIHAQWSRLRRRLPLPEVLDAWRRGDRTRLFEPMLLVGRSP